MVTDVLHALCALAVLFMPLGFAWFMLTRVARKRSRPKKDALVSKVPEKVDSHGEYRRDPRP